MEMLRAICNFAQADDFDLVNPVETLSEQKLWNKKRRRVRIVQDMQLASWYQAVGLLENESFKDSFVFILFTGLRKSEMFELSWDRVDFSARTIFIA